MFRGKKKTRSKDERVKEWAELVRESEATISGYAFALSTLGFVHSIISPPGGRH